MVLIIDTTDKVCEVGLFDGANIDLIKWQWKKDTGSEVLKNLEQLLKKHKKNLQDIGAFCVNQGPGSYTGTRLGIVIANTLGWANSIPVIGYSNQNLEVFLPNILKKINSKEFKFNHFPIPKY